MDREESALKFKIRSLIPELSRSEAAVAEYILNHSDNVIDLSVSALADLCGVSEPTVIRACRTIGFSGYQALKIALIKSAENIIEYSGEEVAAEDDMKLSIQKVFGAANDAINLTRDSLDVQAMEKAAEGKRKVRVHALKTKYPQGGEKSLIRVIAGLDFPRAMLPAEVGCIVINAGTTFAIQRAVLYKEPMFIRGMTITGDAIKEPGNYFVRTGTLLTEIIEAAGGIKEGVTLKKALAGGPMMGFAISNLDVPTQKVTNGLTLLAEDDAEKVEKTMSACLHCGRCTTVCPVGLMPQMMAEAFEFNNLERYEKQLYGLECVECGSCTYICPSKRPLMQTFKRAKGEIMQKKREEAAKAAAEAAKAGGAK